MGEESVFLLPASQQIPRSMKPHAGMTILLRLSTFATAALGASAVVFPKM